MLTLPAALSLCLIPSIAYAHGYEGLFGLVMGFSVDVLAIHAVLSIIACRKLPNRSTPIFILSIILITISFIIIAYTLNIFFGTGGIIIAIIILLAFFYFQNKSDKIFESPESTLRDKAIRIMPRLLKHLYRLDIILILIATVSLLFIADERILFFMYGSPALVIIFVLAILKLRR